MFYINDKRLLLLKKKTIHKLVKLTLESFIVFCGSERVEDRISDWGKCDTDTLLPLEMEVGQGACKSLRTLTQSSFLTK